MTAADADASTLMSDHAFGAPTGAPPPFTLRPGLLRWAVFDGDTLVAKANDREYESMIGGRRVATAGVAGVAVAPEYRGTGQARNVMTHLLAKARERGAVISTLFRTAPALYRSLGFEQVANLVDAQFPVSALRGMRALTTTLRRARPDDAPAMHHVYATIAASGSGLLSRDGRSFPQYDSDLMEAVDGVTLAVDRSGEVVGYVSWNRGSGYGAHAALSVTELLAVTADGYRALLSAIGSFGAVTPTVRIRSSGDDPIHWLIPGAGWAVTEVSPYMLRVVDLAGAMAARGWPASAVADVRLRLDDLACPWNTGYHRLRVGDGIGRVETADAGPATVIAPNGLAVLYAGGVSVSALRRAGLLSDGSAETDAALDAVFAGPRPAILDFF